MKCPYCGYQESKVVDSRHSDDGLSIRRRRECLQCQKRFTTYETVESLPIVVIKRDSSRQQFDRNKILNGMLRACEKRPVPLAELERATDEIEQAIQNSLDREISTEKIGELVMERLKPLDEVAYVRFPCLPKLPGAVQRTITAALLVPAHISFDFQIKSAGPDNSGRVCAKNSVYPRLAALTSSY